MDKRTLGALFAFVVLGVVAFVTLRAPEKGQREGAAKRPIAAFKAADITELELTSDKQTKLTIVRNPTLPNAQAAEAEWTFGKGGMKADPAQLKQLTEQLEKMSFGDLVSENEGKQEELGVVEGKAPRLVVKAGTRVLADLLVGKNVGSATMVRIPGTPGTWQLTGITAGTINKDQKTLRDHTVLELGPNDGEKLSIATANGNVLVVDKAPDAAGGAKKWKVVDHKGQAPADTAALDSDLVQSVLASLASLKANDFADDKKPADVGLDKPTLTITVTTKTADKVLLIGATIGDDTFVQAAGKSQIYVLKKFAIDRIAKRPIDFGDKTLTKIKEADLASIDLVGPAVGGTVNLDRAGTTWKTRVGTSDPNKCKGVAGAFEALNGVAIVESGEVDKAGLKTPTATVTLHTNDKKTLVLKVGAETADKSEYYVQKVGNADVVRAKKYLVDRFLKKAADLAATPPTEKKKT